MTEQQLEQVAQMLNCEQDDIPDKLIWDIDAICRMRDKLNCYPLSAVELAMIAHFSVGGLGLIDQQPEEPKPKQKGKKRKPETVPPNTELDDEFEV